jgi:hypothetical protein
MRLSKLNNVVVRNSLYVLLFVVSYTVLLRYYNTEFFVDTNIDTTKLNTSQQVDKKPIVTVPVFQPYQQNSADKNPTTDTPKEKTTETASTTKEPPSQKQVSTSTITTPTSFFASITYKFVLYVLLSVVLIVLIIWGALSLTKARTVPNSTFQKDIYV